MKRVIAGILVAIFVVTPAFAEERPQTEPSKDLPSVDDSIEVEGKKPKSPKEWLKSQPRKKKGALKGALGGAAAGALGALALGKDPLAGAAIGATAGALTGYLIGRRKDKLFAARDAAVAEIGYDPSQGYVINVQEVRFDPPNLEPGGSSEMYVRYLVVGPNPKEKIVVQSYTGIKYEDNYMFGVGPKKVVIPRGGGIIETTMELTLPEESPAGSYTVEAQFEEKNGQSSETGQGPLYVTVPEGAEGEATATS